MCALTYWVCDVFSCGHVYFMACSKLVYWALCAMMQPKDLSMTLLV